MRHIHLFILSFVLCSSQIVYAQSTCETITQATLQRLPEVLRSNNFEQIQTISNTLQSSCPKSELALRLEILIQIIQKQSTTNSIKNYLQGHYDDILITRYDDAAQKNYEKLFKSDPKKYEYIPLKSPIDSLIQQKAKALLNSNSYTLNQEELAITYLFADYIDNFYQELNKQPKRRPMVDNIRDRELYKNRIGYQVHLGTYIPLGSADFFLPSPTLGFTLQGPLKKLFIPEFNYTLRINNNKELMSVQFRSEWYEVKAQTSHSFSAGLGYKIYDSGKFILLPKIRTGLGLIWTGISSSYYIQDDYGYDVEQLDYKNINTWQNSAGIAALWHLNKKLYIGMETSYQNAPYHWDRKLKTDVQSNFLSIDAFVRF